MSISPQNSRPSSVSARVKQAQEQYALTRAQFKTNDFLDWKQTKKLPNDEEVTIGYDEFIPPYSNRYPTALGWVFSCIDQLEVAQVLSKHFSQPDLLDVDYLDDTLNEIEGILSCGYSFSSESNDGIDYYNGYGNEREMMSAEFAGVDTSNRGEWRVTANIERARKWLARAEAAAAIPSVATHDTIQSASNFNEGKGITPPLLWEGTGVELLDLFVSLQEKGYIKLPGAINGPDHSWPTVCQAICGLFDLSGFRRPNSIGEPWETLDTYFNTKEKDKLTKEDRYAKLNYNKRKFDTIKPRKLGLTGPE